MPEVNLNAVELLASQLSPDDQLRLMSRLATGLSRKVVPPTKGKPSITWLTAGGVAPGLTGMDAQEWVDELRQGWSQRLESLSGDAE